MENISFVRFENVTAAPLLTEKLVETYQAVFAGSPWFEQWSREQVLEDLQHEITPVSSCWLAMKKEQVIGFCWGHPITIAELEKKLGIGTGLPGDERVAYQAELGVLENFRGQGIARELFQRRRIDFLRQELVRGVVRTKEGPPPSVTYTWYLHDGYRVVARYPDGTGRVIMTRRL
ncbi:MAG TPA: GNAT family N-acetyltransferase [Patescibacteria group bacterium]|nr:GNAT family N-acetyltransferase [Patescibacteria group bacterium]